MTLEAGTRFGACEVVEPIGSGGMGEVYRATDTSLKRDVAIKVLPAAVAADGDRLARFQREAELLASLNHPNIAQVHGLETSDGQSALVMELVAGPTLADRIEQGALPPDEATGIAHQILNGLEAAHAKGIVHRDLKPANVKLTPDGVVKVLDFGIAKALDSSGDSGAGKAQLTTPAMTEAGIALGTAAYMSPEQARGRPVDQRADIWAFGCVLYEMLTGQPAFGGEDRTSTLARVLEREVNLKTLPAGIDESLRTTIDRCLEKDPRRRWHHVGDVRLGLEGELSASGDSAGAAPPARTRRWPVAVAAASAAAVVTVVAMLAIAPPPTDDSVPSRYTIRAPDGSPISSYSSLAFSRDGQRLMFQTGLGGSRGLYSKIRGQFDAAAIGSRGLAGGLFVSSPGNEIGFFSPASNQLMSLDPAGGSTRILADVPGFNGADWIEDGTIVVATGWGKPLGIVRSANSELDVLTTLDYTRGERAHLWPAVMPDRQHALFTIWSGKPAWSDAELAVADLETGAHRIVLEGGVHGRYVDSGHIVFWRGNALWAVPFDAARLETTGDPIRVVGDVRMTMGDGSANFAISTDGALAYVQGGEDVFVETMIVDRAGAIVRRLDTESPAGNAAFSPDGRRVALVLYRGGLFNIGVIDLDRDLLERVWTGSDGDAVTWVDNERLSFQANPDGTYQEYMLSADGSGTPRPLFDTPPAYHPDSASWSADGNVMIYTAPVAASTGIWRMDFDGDSGPELIIDSPDDELDPELSPRGDLLAYMAIEAGQAVVYVRPYPAVDTRRITIAAEGARSPVWSADGTYLYYATSDGIFEVQVRYDAAGTASLERPALVVPMTGIAAIDVAPDRETFAVSRLPLETAAREIRVIEDFVDGLRQL